MTTLFAKIIAGEIPCHRIMENESFLAFLDIRPVKQGHTLIVPKIEIDYIFDIEDDLLSQMILFAKKVAVKLKASLPCRRIGVMVAGLEVPHAHIHLIPMDQIADLNFANACAMTPDELSRIQKKITGQSG